MGRIPPTFHMLAKEHTLVSNSLNPGSMSPIRAITTTTFGTLISHYITGRSVRELVHIHFPVARDLRFITRTITIREKMGLTIVETNGSVARVMTRMKPTLSLRHIPSIVCVQIMVGIICEVEDIENALESIA